MNHNLSSNYIFKANTIDGYAFKVLCELLHNTIKIACLVVNKDGISLRMMDSQQKILIHTQLHSENFNLFYFDVSNSNNGETSINIGLNLAHLFRMLRSVKKRDSIELYIAKDNEKYLSIKIIPRDMSRIVISTIKIQPIENLEIELPKKFENSILVNSNEFAKLLKDLMTISPSIHVMATQFYIKFYSDVHSIYSREVILGNFNGTMDKQKDNEYCFDEIFDSDVIGKILKISGLSTYLQLCFEKDMPFLVSSKIGQLGNINIYLKSKKQIEDERYA
jgi:proliferating cell nuclear antigen PCNA